MSINLINICKSFGKIKVIHNVTLTVETGEFVVFVGPSGCGKSTLLRMIAGLESISEGQLMIGGQDVSDWPPSKRGIAMVFQSYALYPHLNVFENMAFSLRIAKMDKATITEKIHAAADILQLTPYLNRLPKGLSGGQRQRVAIGRAIVRNPQVFLFDEPLSNLDASLRSDMRVELSDLHQKLDTTMIYVTHDQVEAMTLASRIVVLNGGRVEQIGTPMELYNTPQTPFVAGFIGSPKMNFFGGAMAQTAGGDLCGVRPEHFKIAKGKGAIKVRLKHLELLGADSLCYFENAEYGDILVRQEGQVALTRGQDAALNFNKKDLHVFKNEARV